MEEVKIEPTRKISKRVFKKVETASGSDEIQALRNPAKSSAGGRAVFC